MNKQFLRWVASIMSVFALLFTFLIIPGAKANEVESGPMVGFMMTPMNESITLKPGDTHSGFFHIINPEQNTASVEYRLEVQSFYRDEEGNAIFEDVDGRSEITNWITLDIPETGTLAPNESVRVAYTINVPFDVPEGGQYAAITATSLSPEANGLDSANLTETIAMAYTIFAEVEGHTIRSADITDTHIPNFISDGNITATSTTTNTGNIHGTATYTMEVFPLFSNTPAYSNKDNPDKKLILPHRAFVHTISWENTPLVGIFNIHYRVDFEGGEFKDLVELVIKCPIWLLLIVLIVITIIIVFIVAKIKSHKKKNSVENE